MHHSNDEFIGVDYGSVRVGLARGSSAARLAEPLRTVAETDALAEIISIAEDSQAAGIVIGLPRNLEGKDTAQTKLVRDWVNTAKDKIGLPFYWQDEALTSAAAAYANDIDAAAAAGILQDFLDTPEEERVRC